MSYVVGVSWKEGPEADEQNITLFAQLGGRGPGLRGGLQKWHTRGKQGRHVAAFIGLGDSLNGRVQGEADDVKVSSLGWLDK